MAKTKFAFDDLTQISSRSELRAALAMSRLSLSIPQAQTLSAHAKTLTPGLQPLRLGVVHTYTSDLLDPWLDLAASLEGLEIATYHAPYGLALQEAREGSDLLAHQPDVTLLLLRREDIHPDLQRPITGLPPADQQALGAEFADRLLSIAGQFRAHKIGQLVVTLLPSLTGPGLGVYDAQAERSESAWWASTRTLIGTRIRETLNATVYLDLDEVVQQVGRQSFFDQRYWYSARFPFAADAARELARRVVSIGVLGKTPKAKVIVLDADNTLWGGVIGEDGMNGIGLGPDYPGSAFVDFQKRLLAYQQRGFILALCSKNNTADLDQVLREHPHQVLKDEHFAARRVNWVPKPDNLISLAEELNLGLDSFIFVDDSDHECAAVRHRLPQVEVIQTPSRPVDVPTCLDHVARLEVLTLTAEDLAKTEMYAQERRRREFSEKLEQGGSGAGDYLAKLEMKMRIGLDPAEHLARLSQLTQKTNQFNLTTRRYDEHQMQGFIDSNDWVVADFSLADTFGDSGIVGLAMFRKLEAKRAELDTFLMSCRVIGREAESAFMHSLLRLMADQGVEEVIADYKPTAKNELVKNFLPQQGFRLGDDGRYRMQLAETPPKPESAFPIQMDMPIVA
jgi:FkbH-like protein